MQLGMRGAAEVVAQKPGRKLKLETKDRKRGERRGLLGSRQPRPRPSRPLRSKLALLRELVGQQRTPSPRVESAPRLHRRPLPVRHRTPKRTISGSEYNVTTAVAGWV